MIGEVLLECLFNIRYEVNENARKDRGRSQEPSLCNGSKTIDMNGPNPLGLYSLYGAMPHAPEKDTARQFF